MRCTGMKFFCVGKEACLLRLNFHLRLRTLAPIFHARYLHIKNSVCAEKDRDEKVWRELLENLSFGVPTLFRRRNRT